MEENRTCWWQSCNALNAGGISPGLYLDVPWPSPWGSKLSVTIAKSVPLCCLGSGSYSRSLRKTAITEIPTSQALFLRLWIWGSDVHPPCSLSMVLSIKVTAILNSQSLGPFVYLVSSLQEDSVSLWYVSQGVFKLFQCRKIVFEVILMTNTLCKFGKTLHSHPHIKQWQMKF